MAWLGEENFNSYSDGDLNGKNGGSGWSAAWSGSANYDVQGTTVYEGTKAVVNATNANADISRTLTTATTSGTVYIAIRRTDTGATGQWQFQFRKNGVGSVFSILMDSGNVSLVGSSTITLVSGYSADTWYVIRITYSGLGGTPSITAAYNTGSGWSAESSDSGATNNQSVDQVLSSIDALGVGVSVYLDYISASSPFSFTADVSDIFTLSDATTNVKGFVATISDSIGLTEAITNIRALIKSVTDSIGITENINASGLWTEEDEVTTNWTDES